MHGFLHGGDDRHLGWTERRRASQKWVVFCGRCGADGGRGWRAGVAKRAEPPALAAADLLGPAATPDQEPSFRASVARNSANSAGDTGLRSTAKPSCPAVSATSGGASKPETRTAGSPGCRARASRI